ncbi:hypothetical protein JIN77_15360 [Verrucomicrobiaceae bacterium R5-34]|nr:hypothetical protein [Verrucomicrobiaceae bacterium R5-34]
MKINQFTFLCIGLIMASCAPQASDSPSSVPVAKVVTPERHTVDGMHEVMKFTDAGREVIVALDWRKYSTAKDSALELVYGDMSRPPAQYMVDQLTVSIDGKGVAIPAANYSYLGSQWMNEIKHLGVYKSGSKLNIYVNVGDGSEAWTASYLIDPATGTLVSHKVYDGAEFHNNFAP